MIRKNSLFCKIIRIKTSSKFIFDSFMRQFRPELQTCPVCKSTGNCHIHDYYDRSIIDFKNNRVQKESLCIMRVFCESCSHAHAILPDIIIPYSRYSLFFLLRLLGEYFADLYTVARLCKRYDICENRLYKWLALWQSHKQQWLGLLDDTQKSNFDFLKELLSYGCFSDFSMSFTLQTSFSFLQMHKNPTFKRPKNANCHQNVLSPFYFIL